MIWIQQPRKPFYNGFPVTYELNFGLIAVFHLLIRHIFSNHHKFCLFLNYEQCNNGKSQSSLMSQNTPKKIVGKKNIFFQIYVITLLDWEEPIRLFRQGLGFGQMFIILQGILNRDSKNIGKKRKRKLKVHTYSIQQNAYQKNLFPLRIFSKMFTVGLSYRKMMISDDIPWGYQKNSRFLINGNYRVF